MEYLLDNIIIPSLKNNLTIKFKGFLKVLEDSDNPLLTKAAKNLGMQVLNYPFNNYLATA